MSCIDQPFAEHVFEFQLVVSNRPNIGGGVTRIGYFWRMWLTATVTCVYRAKACRVSTQSIYVEVINARLTRTAEYYYRI